MLRAATAAAVAAIRALVCGSTNCRVTRRRPAPSTLAVSRTASGTLRLPGSSCEVHHRHRRCHEHGNERHRARSERCSADQGRQLPERSTGPESVGQEDRDTEGGAGHQQQGRLEEIDAVAEQPAAPFRGPCRQQAQRQREEQCDQRIPHRRADDFGHRRGEQRLLGAQHRRHCSDPQDHHDAQDEDAEQSAAVTRIEWGARAGGSHHVPATGTPAFRSPDGATVPAPRHTGRVSRTAMNAAVPSPPQAIASIYAVWARVGTRPPARRGSKGPTARRRTAARCDSERPAQRRQQHQPDHVGGARAVDPRHLHEPRVHPPPGHPDRQVGDRQVRHDHGEHHSWGPVYLGQHRCEQASPTPGGNHCRRDHVGRCQQEPADAGVESRSRSPGQRACSQRQRKGQRGTDDGHGEGEGEGEAIVRPSPGMPVVATVRLASTTMRSTGQMGITIAAPAAARARETATAARGQMRLTVRPLR